MKVRVSEETSFAKRSTIRFQIWVSAVVSIGRNLGETFRIWKIVSPEIIRDTKQQTTMHQRAAHTNA